MDPQELSFRGQVQYDPTWNPYHDSGNAQAVPLDFQGDPHKDVRSMHFPEATIEKRTTGNESAQTPSKPLSASERRENENSEDYETEQEQQEIDSSLGNNLGQFEVTNHEAAEAEDHVPEIVPIRAEPRPTAINRSSTQGSQRSRAPSESELFQSLSRRWTHETRERGEGGHEEEIHEIERLLTKMFGKSRREHSEEEKTRHVGVVWKNLSVTGEGLGATVQGTIATPFYTLRTLFTKGPKGVKHKPPVRTIIDSFTGCLKPGEMCLVLGRPGSGCSSFLKVLANQRSGYKKVEGDVTYGGTNAETMQKKYRGDIIYNPEDDLHYATLKVKDTLGFAIQSRTPGKESREAGESKKQYQQEFLQIIAKLFWIEHTLDTKGE